MEKCRDRLKEEIKSVESNLAQAGQHLASATETTIEALDTRLKESQTNWESTREHAALAGKRIKHFVEEARDNAISKFEDWKTDREIGKLEKDADKKEEHAVDAIAVAAFAILEAEVAIVEALKARKTATEVAG